MCLFLQLLRVAGFTLLKMSSPWSNNGASRIGLRNYPQNPTTENAQKVQIVGDFSHLAAHQYIVSETYDLMNTTNFEKHGNEYYLYKPADASNLSSIRFRSFKPILKSSISNINISSVTVDIYPMIWKYTLPVGSTTGSTSTAVFGENYKLYNYADGVAVEIAEDSYTCSLAGSVEDLVKNINNVIGAYCSNLKPSGTIMFMDLTDDSAQKYALYYGGSPAITACPLNTYYEQNIPETWYNLATNNEQTKAEIFAANDVEAQQIFSYLSYDSESNTFYTNNLGFFLGTYPGTPSGSENLYLSFVFDVYFDPADLINVSLFRQFYNCVEAFGFTGHYYIQGNSCISTNPDFSNGIKLLYYQNSGIVMGLFCVYMKNLSGIVFVNSDESDVYMKEINQPTTMNFIPVQIKEINGTEISTDLLESLFSSIIVQVDYVYNLDRF